MIIGLNGRKQAGKDTVGAYLVRHYGFERRAFADLLKKSMAGLFDIPVGELEILKNQPEIELRTTYCGTYAPQGPLIRFNFRQLLQRYGEEAHRIVLDPDIWVNYTLPEKDHYDKNNIVLTDVRYRNEAERVQKLGGFVVYIDRNTGEQDSHGSEQPLPVNLVDYMLNNNGSFDDLYLNIKAMVQHLSRG